MSDEGLSLLLKIEEKEKELLDKGFPKDNLNRLRSECYQALPSKPREFYLHCLEEGITLYEEKKE